MSWFERAASMTIEERQRTRAELIEQFATTEYAEILAEILDEIRSSAVVEIVNGKGQVEFERGRVSAVQDIVGRLQLIVAIEARRKVLRQEEEMNLLRGDHWRTYGSAPGLV